MEINTELTDADIIDPRDMDDDVRDLVELMLQSGNYMSKDSQVVRYYATSDWETRRFTLCTL